MADETEHQLREKIASQKGSIADLPTLRSIARETGLVSCIVRDNIARVQLIEYLSDDEEKLELLLESKRVDAVVRLQDELHAPEDSEDCSILLLWWVYMQTVPHESDAKCREEGFDEMYRGKCPLCRGIIPMKKSYKELRSEVLEHSYKEKAWAQLQLGIWYSGEDSGSSLFPTDKAKGLQFIKQAAVIHATAQALRVCSSVVTPSSVTYATL